MSAIPGHDLLGPDGGLAAAMPGYEDRRGQRAMADAVARAIEDERPLVVEAGTGTGKTLAYLVPAVASGKRVVISTGTKSLQDQLARHDIPLLRTISPRPFEAVVLKGISNYVCRRRLAEAIARTASGTTAADRDQARQLAAIARWADRSATGDRAEVDDLAEDAPVWVEATTTPESRVGKSCPHFERCFVTQARRAAETADLIVVNHHLYFADLALRGAFPGARVLPDHDVVIFDEAHQLEDVATEHFGARVSSVRIGQLVRDAHVAFGHLALWSARTTSSAGATKMRAGWGPAVRTSFTVRMADLLARRGFRSFQSRHARCREGRHSPGRKGSCARQRQEWPRRAPPPK